MNMNSIRGKWALITGATSGFGKATADLFAKEGCNVIITGRRAEKLEAISKSATPVLNEEYFGPPPSAGAPTPGVQSGPNGMGPSGSPPK